MKPTFASPLASPLLVGAMALALAVLAGLQYRWIGELSEAEKARLERSLDRSAHGFRRAFNERLQEFASGLTPDMRTLSSGDIRDATLAQFGRARQSGELHLDGAWLRAMDLDAGSELWQLSADAQRWESIAADSPGTPATAAQPLRGIGRRSYAGGRPTLWTFLAEERLLVHPLIRWTRDGGRPRPELTALLFIRPDGKWLREELFPELFAQAFGAIDELSYQALIVEQSRTPQVIYASDPSLEPSDFARADVRLPLLWSRDEADGRGPERTRQGRPPRGSGPPERQRPPRRGPLEPGRAFDGLIPTFESGVAKGPGPEWVFWVQHREGTLDTVVARLRRRNLFVSSGIMVLLAAGMAALFVSTRRARRLADLQMEFVAGVSHDLRTPLAVIRSAGDNLAEGVVAEPDQVREYGRLIRGEGRRLTGMVEQTLQFAAVQSGKRQYRIQTIAADELIRQAVADAMPMAEEAGVSVELDLPDALPPVAVDVAAASHSLQNLIGNSAKYGGEARWVGVAARATPEGVDVTVRDRGPGIDPQELPRIFEPFFRGRRAIDDQIKGSGLGLALARSDAEGFGGSLTVESSPGKGAAFTLRLPAAKESDGV